MGAGEGVILHSQGSVLGNYVLVAQCFGGGGESAMRTESVWKNGFKCEHAEIGMQVGHREMLDI